VEGKRQNPTCEAAPNLVSVVEPRPPAYNQGMAIGSHVIPRFYLEQFANPNRKKNRPGKVWTYEKGKEPQLRGTDSQGYENGYFAFLQPDGTLDESFEAKLATLEERCNDTLVCAKSRLFDLRPLIGRTTLGFYMGLLFARSTSRRKFSAGNWAKMQGPFAQLEFNEDYVRDTAAHFSETTGETVTADDIRQLIRNQAARFSKKEETNNSFIQDLLFQAETLKTELVPKAWQVWEAPAGSEFVTSDNPVVTFVRLAEDLWHPGHGYRKPNVVVAFPLAPTACLTVGIGGPDFLEVDAAKVTRLNEMVIRSCDRFVYSKIRSQEILQMVNDCARTSVPGENAFVGAFPDEKRIEEHLRRTMGIRRRGDS